jgi:hypothetical protein
MTVQPEKMLGKGNQSLSSKISQAADRLDRRKRTAAALGRTLRSRLLYGWASPGVLFIAGGTGFLAAEWINRPTSSPPPAREKPSESTSSRRSQTTVLSKALLLSKIALDLRTRWIRANPQSAAGVRQRTDERHPQEHAVSEPGY